jgi:hypothetical protein
MMKSQFLSGWEDPTMRRSVKTIVSMSAYFLATAIALGQATVWFGNRIDSQAEPLDVPFFDDQGVRLEGPSYVAQLYFWTDGSFQPAGSLVPFAANGYFYSHDDL